MEDIGLEIVCPTRGRAEVIGSKTFKFLPFARYLVDEEDEDAYRKALGEEALIDTTTVRGCAKVFGYAWDAYKTESIVLIDDDIKSVKVINGQRARSYTNHEDVYQLVESMMTTARGIGASFFAAANIGNPLYYNTNKPFSLNFTTGSVKGQNGYPRPLKVDPRLNARDDINVMMEALVRDHFMFADERLRFDIGVTSLGKGGNQLTKTSLGHNHDVDILKNRYGNLIELETKSDRVEGVKIRYRNVNDKVGKLFK